MKATTFSTFKTILAVLGFKDESYMVDCFESTSLFWEAWEVLKDASHEVRRPRRPKNVACDVEREVSTIVEIYNLHLEDQAEVYA